MLQDVARLGAGQDVASYHELTMGLLAQRLGVRTIPVSLASVMVAGDTGLRERRNG
jgi:hypothetical protein